MSKTKQGNQKLKDNYNNLQQKHSWNIWTENGITVTTVNNKIKLHKKLHNQLIDNSISQLVWYTTYHLLSKELKFISSPKPTNINTIYNSSTTQNSTNPIYHQLTSTPYQLKNNNDIIIKQADKGGAIVIWPKKDYLAEAYKQLNTNHYQRIRWSNTTANQNTTTIYSRL